MQHFDYYSEPETMQPHGVLLSPEDTEALAKLMRELQDLTQSRASHAAAGEFLSRLTGEARTSSVVRHDILAQ